MSQDPAAHQNDIIGRFAQHRVAANLLMLILLMAGAVALIKLNTQFLPHFNLDFINVRVVWAGASAEDVATSITTPLEQELRSLDNIKEMRSTSTRGFSSIVLEYEQGSDLSLALDKVKERVAQVRNLPDDAEEPQIVKIERYEDVASLIISSEDGLDALRPWAHQFERELLDAGISRVSFEGLPDEEMAIEIPRTTIAELGMTLPELGQRVVGQSQDLPAGTLAKTESARELRSLTKQRTADGFGQLAVLTSRDGRELRLGDIAHIERRPKEASQRLYYRGQPAVLLKVQRLSSADALKMAEIFNNWFARAETRVPDAIHLHRFNETYILLEDRINLLLKNGIGGLILVIAILYIFLNGRVAFWVAMGIPISFMGTLAVLYLVGGSINMVSLFALIMALGIIVDDAIVVGEDALAHYQSGESSLQAAEGGARRMFIPVMSSSLTTIAAFLPLLVISGIIGTILKAIPIVIICTIIASLVESFLILPGHLRHSFHRNHHKQPSALRQRLDEGFNRFRDQVFRPVITAALHNRALTLILTFSVLVFSVSLVAGGRIPFTFFPSPDGNYLIASVKFSAGTPPERVHAFALHMEEKLRALNDQLDEPQPVVEHALVKENSASFDGGQNRQFGEQYASVVAQLSQPDDRSVTNARIVELWQNSLDKAEGIEILSISAPRGGPPGRDIDIFLNNAEPDVLKDASAQIQAELAGYEGVTNIQDDLPFGKQQLVYTLSPTGRALGLTVQEIGRQLRAGYEGQLLQIFFDEEDQVEVRIMMDQAERNSEWALDSFPIVTRAGVVPLNTVAELTSRRGLELLRHTDGRLGVHVTAEVDTTRNNANNILGDLDERFLAPLSRQMGFDYVFKGRSQEQRETGADMKLGALVGLTLIYLILAWVFASWFWPLAIMMAIPFGLAGALLGHWILGIDLTILSLFGFFGLSGIVVNDSIILVSFYQELRKKGVPRIQALIDASCLRLRAVLLTSLTTIAGLTPLLFETSFQAQFLIPMAVSISFGLLVSTLLVLVVIPVILSLIEGIIARNTRWRERGRPVDNHVENF
ncbi:efflux RND transporter permease subunit [Hahella sp. SMD15-11]|uniref:Efflux RND transporter permease subunit n=1 Tax=Thermohahella caldifontis TaxID=3142973 RepID=A0AB39UWC4_9GAMM